MFPIVLSDLIMNKIYFTFCSGQGSLEIFLLKEKQGIKYIKMEIPYI